MSKRKRNVISYEEAMRDIEKFVHDENSEELSDLDELYGDEYFDINVEAELENNSESDQENNSDNDTEALVEPPVARRKHRRKYLTYQRNVNSIEAALDEGNYDLFDLPLERVTIKGKIPDDSANKKNAKKDISFTNQLRNLVGRQSEKDVIKNKPGVASCAKDIDSPMETFEFFLPFEFMQKIVTITNIKIQKTIGEFSTEIESNKYPHIKEIDVVDLYATFGLMYFRGLYNLNNHDLNILFSEKHGPPPFGATMSRQRFEFIIAHICFDDPETRTDRWKHDRFAAMRDIFAECNRNFARAIVKYQMIT